MGRHTPRPSENKIKSNQFKTLESTPEIWIGSPPVHGRQGNSASLAIINTELPKIIPELASKLGVGFFDAYSGFGGASFNSEIFDKDLLHPNDKGYGLLADIVRSHVFATRVACVGDSITFGSHSSIRETYSYPSQLQGLLGKMYYVHNFGVSGATASKGMSYTALHEYKQSLDFLPDIVVIGFGTNDAKKMQETQFQKDYTSLINSYCNLPTSPTVWVFTPPPLYKDGIFQISQSVVNEKLPTLISGLLNNTCAKKIDMFKVMGGVKLLHPELFADSVHPNDQGYLLMAQTIAHSLTLLRLNLDVHGHV